MLFEAGWQGSERLKVLCGGEAFPLDVAAKLVDRVGSVWNMYGPTETTVWSACHELKEATGSIPIGRPIDNTQIYVLDRHLEPVPAGVPGEIYIGGDGVTRGYLNRPELTAAAFLTTDLGRGPSRLYRTGDLGRFRADGTLEYLARVDNQVKLRGFRIELGEVEARTAEHPGVRQAVAVVREDRPDDKRLVVYVAPSEGEIVAAPDLREHLRATLPEYMIPQHIVMIDAVPLTENGKVDRRALPSPTQAGGTPGDDHVPPSTPTERLLGEIWAEALDVERVGMSDNFFDLGGHSLLAMRVIYQIEEKTGHRLTPMEISLQTLRQLAVVCDRPAAATDRSSLAQRVVNAVRSAVVGK